MARCIMIEIQTNGRVARCTVHCRPDGGVRRQSHDEELSNGVVHVSISVFQTYRWNYPVADLHCWLSNRSACKKLGVGLLVVTI